MVERTGEEDKLMRTGRRGPWTILVGLFIVGAVGCQTLTYVDRCEIPEVKNNPEAGCPMQPAEMDDGGADGASDAGDQ